MIDYSYHLDSKNRGKVKAGELSDFYTSRGVLRPKTLTIRTGSTNGHKITLTSKQTRQKLKNFLSRYNISNNDVVWVSITESKSMSKRLENLISSVVEGKQDSKAALNALTESLDVSAGSSVIVVHGMFAGTPGLVEKELPGGYVQIKTENKALGSIQVPAFAIQTNSK